MLEISKEQWFLFFFWLIIATFIMYLVSLIPRIIKKFINAFIKLLFDKNDIKLYNKTINQNKKQRGNPIIHIDKMSGTQFEIFLKEMFKTLGYNVKRTPDSGDFGADLYMEKNGNSYVVQAKRSKTKIGLAAVQEVVAAKAYYKAEVAIVITNNHLTTNAKILAKNNNVIVYERHELIKLIHKSKMVKKG